jgi:hypothetical protein
VSQDPTTQAERDPCPVCDGLTVARYDAGALPAAAPFCSRCRRRLRAVEIEPADRRRLASLAAAGVLVALVASGCVLEPRTAVPDVAREVHELAAQAERVGAQRAAQRALAADAAWACRQACLTEPAALLFRGDHVECRCRTVPSLGVHRVGARGR